MEGTPEYLDYTEIMTTFLGIDGVVRVHNLRIWVRGLTLRLLGNYDYMTRLCVLSSAGFKCQ
jgi:Co/Zn/Cd efflux system component